MQQRLAIKSVTVSSKATTLGVGLTMQFTATGKYDNGSTLNITDGALWSTTSP